jgi:hypothetical protein
MALRPPETAVKYAAAIAAGSLLGVLLGGAFFVLQIQIQDGRTEIAWLIS